MSMDVAVESDGEDIVLYFSIDAEGVEAQTFGNALISFDGLYRAINGVLNPGLDIEIEFIRSDQGSIRAILRSFKKDTKTLLDHPFSAGEQRSFREAKGADPCLSLCSARC